MGGIGAGFFSASATSSAGFSIRGNLGYAVRLFAEKSKQLVKSPQTARCQGLIDGILPPNRFSMNWPTEVWSNTWEFTHPPRLHGEITYIGTRAPRPHGRTF